MEEQVAAKCRALRAAAVEDCDDKEPEGDAIDDKWEVDTGEETIGCRVESYQVKISEEKDEDDKDKDQEKVRKLRRSLAGRL